MSKVVKPSYIEHYGQFFQAMKPGQVCRFETLKLSDETSVPFEEQKGCVHQLSYHLHLIRFDAANHLADRIKIVKNDELKCVEVVRL